MKSLFLIILSAMMSFGETPKVTKENITQPISVAMTKMEKKVRNAAVKVHSPNGHGSGSLIKYKGSHFIITAFHVVEAERIYFGKTFLIQGINQTKNASLVYFNKTHDIAVLYLPKEEHFHYTTPMKWKPHDGKPPVGVAITYSGYPSWHNLMTFRGRVAGYEVFGEIGEQIILNIYGWFGSSGSVVYTEKGDIIGLLWAVDVEQHPAFQVNEDMVWISPVIHINMKEALRAVCSHAVSLPRGCEQ
mgnify:CR=1 FL=1